MELRVLQYFLAIAREETISGAAQQLHITQPTLSRQIKELEDELGKTLFVRSHKKITLTEEGMILRQRAEEIVNLVDKTELEIMSTDSHLKGEIYIGSGESHALKIITKAIKKIQAQYPDIQFHIHSGNAPDVIEKLDNGLIDFALLTPNSKINDYNHMLLPLSHHWGVLMLKDDPLAQKESIIFEDLRDKPLIVSKELQQISDSHKSISIFLKYCSRHHSRIESIKTYSYKEKYVEPINRLHIIISTTHQSTIDFVFPKLLHYVHHFSLYVYNFEPRGGQFHH